MRRIITRISLFALFSGFVFSSCSKEIDSNEPEIINGVSATGSLNAFKPLEVAVNLPNNIMSHDIPIDKTSAVVPSECRFTPFDVAISESYFSNIDELGEEWRRDYADLNFYYTLTDESTQYFGSEGQYTNLVKKITRKLEGFWNMRNEVDVRGQHNATLDDEEKIVGILTFWYGFPQDLAESYADYFVNFINVNSTFLIESPFVSLDGFAIHLDGLFDQGDIIVIGDGLVELATDAGVEDKVVWNGIMAHEWAHQIQFNNQGTWSYPGVDLTDPAEDTRSTELEADFFTGYYLTHKRGGTYNWKRVSEFLELFFNIGDCSFTSSGHHGTPLQRMEAARLGYELAKSAKKNGHILSENHVHDIFVSSLSRIVGEPVNEETTPNTFQ